MFSGLGKVVKNSTVASIFLAALAGNCIAELIEGHKVLSAILGVHFFLWLSISMLVFVNYLCQDSNSILFCINIIIVVLTQLDCTVIWPK